MSLVSPFINAGYAGYAVDAQRWPKFAAFTERAKAHEVIANIVTIEAEKMGFGGQFC